MALKKDFVKNGRIFVDAYIRIDVLQKSKIGANRLEVTIYTDRECKSVIDTMVYSCVLSYDSDRNFTEQAYDYLKTLDLFADAEDVLEAAIAEDDVTDANTDTSDEATVSVDDSDTDASTTEE